LTSHVREFIDRDPSIYSQLVKRAFLCIFENTLKEASLCILENILIETPLEFATCIHRPIHTNATCTRARRGLLMYSREYLDRDPSIFFCNEVAATCVAVWYSVLQCIAVYCSVLHIF